jgi:hypothetical protein
MIKRFKTAVCLLLFLAPSSGLFAQQTIPDSLNGVVYRGAFDNVARGVIDGNLIETNFRNHGELSRWNDLPWGVWPRGVGGRHIDGIGVVVSAYVDGVSSDRVETLQDYIDIINDPNFEPDTTLNPVIINYREAGARTSPYNGDLWGWLPLPGFNNANRIDPITLASAPVPALSNDTESWPDFWPDRLGEDASGWPGTWNGRDGRFPSSDLESYYVMDDFSDYEYAVGIETDGPHSGFGVYYPSPEEDPSMGGLGLQTQIRLFQWANILAEDAMFIIYRITNKSEKDQTRLFFSQIVDYGLGQDEQDDNATYDPFLDVVYGWDTDGLADPTNAGESRYELGYAGFAFLESPANDANGLDDDQDGIVDESRFLENYLVLSSQEEIDTYVTGNYDAPQFELFYGESYDQRPAYKEGIWYTTDENLDWVGFKDNNDNGIWDIGEPLNNDVGADGLGPFDLNYPGPDTGEGDGLPTNGEPNYNELDVDESDQIGLTGFDLNTRPFYESGDNLRDDTWLFTRIAATLLSNPDYVEPSTVVANEPFILFTSGEVELFSENKVDAKSTDFFSTAWIFGNDEGDFFKNRKTVQNIYNSDYNFAQPPIMPTLTAVTGDEQVVLSWDTLSVNSFDRFLQDFDFEGYKLYKGTNNLLSDSRTISDVNGTPTFYQPIAQWDLDNDISGTIRVLEGDAVYNMGSNTGLEFYYVDNDVTNGKLYYYALVAYDRGISSSGGDDPGIDPQENTFRVSLNGAGAVVGTSINAAAVIPTTNPAGFVGGGTDSDLSKVTEGTGTGSASISVAVEELVDDTKLYEVVFSDSASDIGIQRVTTTYEIREVGGDALVSSTPFSPSTKIVDGFIVNFDNDNPGNIIPTKTGWVANEGQENELFNLDPTELDGISTNWELAITPDRNGDLTNFIRTDHDYEVYFVNPEDSTYRPPLLFGAGFSRFEIPIFARNLITGKQADLFISDTDENGELNSGDILFLAERDERNRVKYRFMITILDNGGTEDVAPSAGDKFRISTTRPFGRDDRFQFTMRKQTVDTELAKESLEDIFVAPNPYLGAASWERKSGSIGRGERKIEFFNLPRKCTIRIFNVRGELVRTLEHDGAFNDGSISWDLRSNDSEDIAYGIYFYHVEAPGIGEYVDKFAIIK